MSKFKFIDRGRKDTLLLIPGWATDYRIFDTIDMAFNYLLPIEYSPFVFLNDLETAMGAYHVKKISILGWSMGCFVACDILSRHRESVDRVIMISARREYDKANNEKIKSVLLKNRKGFLHKFYRDCFAVSERDLYIHMKGSLIKEYIENMELACLIEGLEYLSEHRIDPGILQGVSATFIHGRDDKIAPIAEIAEFLNETPRGRMIPIEHSGHMPFLTPDCKKILNDVYA